MSGHRRYRRDRSSESLSSGSSWSISGSSSTWSLTTETETDDDDDVHGGHRRSSSESSSSGSGHRRSSSESSSSGSSWSTSSSSSMWTSTRETDGDDDDDVHGGGGHRRLKRSSESWSSGSSWSTSRSSMRASTRETDDDADVHGGGHRRLKRSSASLPVLRRSPASDHTWSWVLLNRAGARRDDFRRDHTASAVARTSRGEEISVSFELVEPPGTSVLTVDWPRTRAPASAATRPRKPSANVVAAHRDVVLLAMTTCKSTYPFDFFVYTATRDDPSRRRSRRDRPSLSRLPSAGGPVMYSHLLGTEEIGIMSFASDAAAANDDSPAFVVAELSMRHGASNSNDVSLFRSGSSHWESFHNLHVHGANGGRELRWWTTDGVVPYGRRRCMIWVDYYRGMVLMDLSSATNPPPRPPPRLRYVPLPVDRVGDPEHMGYGERECPKPSRRVCVTRHGVKFVSVDTQHWSNFGVGDQHVLKWSHRFRITTWSLREEDDEDGGGYTWRKDLTMHEEEFWEAFDGGHRRFGFPHVQPGFPVVDVDNPDVVVFQLEKPGRCHRGGETRWMIQVDLRKKVLLAATAYSRKESDGLSGDDEETINSARMEYSFDPIPSELPRYLDDGQACKKRRQ